MYVNFLYWGGFIAVLEKKALRMKIMILVIMQKANLKTEVYKKTKHTRFLKKCTFFTTWYAHELFYKIVNSTVSFFAKKLACVSGGKKCSFFGKFGVLSFLVSFVLRFALWPYHTRWNCWMLLFQEVYCPVLGHYQTYMTEYFSKNS